MTVSEHHVRAAARRLAEAEVAREPCPPVRDLIGSDNLRAAYAVQRINARARVADGARIVGRKIGLTSEAVRRQLGVDQPDFGILFDDMAYTPGATIAADRVLQPRGEVEIAFVLSGDLDGDTFDTGSVRAAVDYAVAAIEVCGSRIAGWDISFGDTVADNASAGAFVLGTDRRRLDDFEPRDAVMSMSVDGVEVSTGAGEACLGDPIAALAWLARQAAALGDPLRAGHVILSGALGPMRAVELGSTVQATVTGLGSVGFTLGAHPA